MRKPLNELQTFLAVYDAKVQTLFFETRALVLTAAPQANELIYDAYNAVTCAYSFSDRLKEAFCHVAAYRKHVNLGFNYGAELPDPKGRLVGTGARIRHIRINSVDQLQEQEIRDILGGAIEQGDSAAPSTGSKGLSTVKAIYERKRARS